MVIVTGLSGAGKTEASRVLEDLGFYVVDNLPATLIPTFADLCRTSGHVSRAALVLDIRERGFFATAQSALSELEARGIPFRVLFLEASDEVLVRRYKQSRREHPLARSRRVIDGITEERQLLGPLRGIATRILDTSLLRPAELREELRRTFTQDDGARMRVHIVSFGFKHGLPSDADLVLDVRFLPNPYYVPDLGRHSGRDREVAEYILGWPVTMRFFELLFPFVDYLVPQYEKEGKAQLVIALGCTGGRHRSVVVGERLAEHLGAEGRAVTIVHRDCDRADESVATEGTEDQ